MFSDFFCQKISTIRQTIDSSSNIAHLGVVDKPFCGNPLKLFSDVSQAAVSALLKKMAPKTCELDPIPTALLFDCSDEVVPALTYVLNESLRSGTFPTVFKQAVVKPLLKKPTLDPNELKNFRPVSNLSFFSKLLEKVVMSQLLDHLNINKLWPRFQSAYRACHSTETALLRVLNDLLTACDDGQVSVLILLDLSAAFDTIDHDILLHRLEHTFGIQDLALSFFRSYLTDRKQMISISGHTSNPTTLLYGVPQGSVLGPILFLLYTQPLSQLIDKHNVSHSEFADDSQLYDSVQREHLPSLISSMQSCVADVKLWMTENKLQLNDGKTEALFIDPRGSPNPPLSIVIGQKQNRFLKISPKSWCDPR
jgi:hypothetical protein